MHGAWAGKSGLTEWKFRNLLNFQQVGGLDCRPVTGEITYGLERIALYIQGVDSVFDLKWNENFSYGDIYHQNEVEQSAYNFKHANVDVFAASVR